MSNPSIPDRLTCRQPYDQHEPGDTMQLGLPLSRRMEVYLESAFRGWSIGERLAQLDQVDERLALAWRVSREGTDIEAVKLRLRVGDRRAYQLLASARKFLAGGVALDGELSEGERWAILRVCDPEAYEVLVAQKWGWRQSAIAEKMTAGKCSREECAGEACGHEIVTVDRVKKLGARGRTVIRGPRRAAQQLYAKRVIRDLAA